MKIQEHPIELLNYIMILMYEPERSKYPFKSITKSFKYVVNMKQKYNKILLDYSKCLKQTKNILEVQVGR